MFAVTTPNINQILALPFKKRPVESRDEFLGLWTSGRDYVRTVSGKHGAYQENKALRRSEEFKWPNSLPNQPDTGQVTYCGRATGNDRFVEFECPAPKRTHVTEVHIIDKLEDISSKLKVANGRVAVLSAKVETQAEELREKTQQIRRAAKRIVDLERKVQELGKDTTAFLIFSNSIMLLTVGRDLSDKR